MLDRTGSTASMTTDGNGKLLSITTKTPDSEGHYTSVTRDRFGTVSSSTVYDGTGKIVSQSAKIMTSTTGTGGSYSAGKGHEKVFLEEGSQKHKEKGMNELFHEDKQKLIPTPFLTGKS